MDVHPFIDRNGRLAHCARYPDVTAHADREGRRSNSAPRILAELTRRNWFREPGDAKILGWLVAAGAVFIAPIC
jgi:hypothetical protein